MSLIEALDNCSDRSILDLAQMKLPFEKDTPRFIELKNKVITNSLENLEKYSFDDLVDIIKIQGYFGIDSSEGVREFVWRLGDDEKLLSRYFTHDAQPKYKLRSDIDKVLWCELVRIYNKDYFPEEISVRFEEIQIINAVRYGNLRLVKYLESSGRKDNLLLLDAAVLSGSLDVVKYITKEHPETHEQEISKYIYYNSLENLDVLKYIYELDPKKTLPDNMTVKAAHYDDINLMKWLIDNKCPVDGRVLFNAVFFANMNLVKWLVDNDYVTRYIDNQNYFKVAGMQGNLELIKYLYEICKNKYNRMNKFNQDFFSGVITSFSTDTKTKIEIIDWVRKNADYVVSDYVHILSLIAVIGDVELFDYYMTFVESDNLCERIFCNAIRSKNIKMMKYLYDKRCPFDPKKCMDAIMEYYPNKNELIFELVFKKFILEE